MQEPSTPSLAYAMLLGREQAQDPVSTVQKWILKRADSASSVGTEQILRFAAEVDWKKVELKKIEAPLSWHLTFQREEIWLNITGVISAKDVAPFTKNE